MPLLKIRKLNKGRVKSDFGSSVEGNKGNTSVESYWKGAFLEATDRGYTEAVARRYSVKKVFLQISQNSQENICIRVSFLTNLQASDL